MNLFLVGLCLGVGLGLLFTYLSTHPEARGALFARLHSTAQQVHDEIAARLAKK